MNRCNLLMVSVVLIISFFTIQNSIADELSCFAAYERMTEDMESAASAANAKDMCRAADMIDSALYWAMQCEKVCTYSKDRMKKVRKTKEDLIYILARYVKICGH